MNYVYLSGKSPGRKRMVTPLQRKKHSKPQIIQSLPPSINLQDQPALATGSIRNIHQVPGHPDLIVKTFRAGKTPADQKRQMHIRKLAFLRHPIVFDQNRYDLREMKRIETRIGEVLYTHFAKVYALHPTSNGTGLLQDNIHQPDGSPAPSLEQAWQNKQNRPDLIKAIERFKSFLSKHHIVIRDLHPANLLIDASESEPPRLIMIDGFGNSDYIKWASFSRTLNDRKLERKFTRLMINLKT